MPRGPPTPPNCNKIVQAVAGGYTFEGPYLLSPGHVDREMMRIYSHLRLAAKRLAVEALGTVKARSRRGVWHKPCHKGSSSAKQTNAGYW
jgi:hypothetical protein